MLVYVARVIVMPVMSFVNEPHRSSSLSPETKTCAHSDDHTGAVPHFHQTDARIMRVVGRVPFLVPYYQPSAIFFTLIVERAETIRRREVNLISIFAHDYLLRKRLLLILDRFLVRSTRPNAARPMQGLAHCRRINREDRVLGQTNMRSAQGR